MIVAKKVLLVIRLLSEAMLGLICMIKLPQQFMYVVLGYLGMPRRYHPPELQRFQNAILLGEFLWSMTVFLIAAICFKDVFKLLRRLRSS